MEVSNTERDPLDDLLEDAMRAEEEELRRFRTMMSRLTLHKSLLDKSIFRELKSDFECTAPNAFVGPKNIIGLLPESLLPISCSARHVELVCGSLNAVGIINSIVLLIEEGYGETLFTKQDIRWSIGPTHIRGMVLHTIRLEWSSDDYCKVLVDMAQDVEDRKEEVSVLIERVLDVLNGK